MPETLTFAAHMRNRLIASFLLIALISSYCSGLFVCAGFKLNQKYIAEQLCVNKSRPSMHCNGRCYLMNKLKQTQEKEKKQQQQEQKSRYHENLPADVFTLNFIALPVEQNYVSPQTPALPHQAPLAVFQPPRA